MTYTLGQPVTMTGTLTKTHEENRTIYRPAPLPDNGTYPEPRRYTDGIIIGRRTVAEGTTHYTMDGAAFIPARHLQVWLVAYALHRVPVYCTDDQLTDYAPPAPEPTDDTLPLFDPEEKNP